MNSLRSATLASLMLIAGCAPTIYSNDPGPPPQTVVIAQGGPDNTRQTLGVPPGHLPRPGQCKIWVQGLPPGHQDKNRSCRGILDRAPAGSMILYRPSDDPSVIHVHYVDADRRGVYVLARVFVAETGVFVREEQWNVHHGDDEDDDQGNGKGHGRGHGHDRDNQE